MSRRPGVSRGCMLVSCADAFAFGYLDEILCLPPHAQPSVGTAFPRPGCCSQRGGVWAPPRATTDFMESHTSRGAGSLGGTPATATSTWLPHMCVCARRVCVRAGTPVCVCSSRPPCFLSQVPRKGLSILICGPWVLGTFI